ncbi:big bang [Carabus blaptoides fortunei]
MEVSKQFVNEPLTNTNLENDESTNQFVTVVSIGTDKDIYENVSFGNNTEEDNEKTSEENGFVTVLTIGDEVLNELQHSEVIEEVLVYRLPGERLGFGLKFEGGAKTTEYVRRLFIQSCAPDSPASRVRCSWGFLSEGDEVLRIDSHSVMNMTRIDCVRCLKDSNVVIKLLMRHCTRESEGFVKDSTSPFHSDEEFSSEENGDKKRENPPPPPIPPRKISRKLNKDKNMNAVPYTRDVTDGDVQPAFRSRQNVPECIYGNTGDKSRQKVQSYPKSAPRSRQSLDSPPKVPARERNLPEANSGPPDAEVYLDLLAQELEYEIKAESESDDTGSTISTVIDKHNSITSDSVPSTPPAVQKQMDLSKVVNPFEKLEMEYNKNIQQNDDFLFTRFVSSNDILVEYGDGSGDHRHADNEKSSVTPPTNFQDAPLSYGNEDVTSITTHNNNRTSVAVISKLNTHNNVTVLNGDVTHVNVNEEYIDDDNKVMEEIKIPTPVPRKCYAKKTQLKTEKEAIKVPMEMNESNNNEDKYMADCNLPRLVNFVPKVPAKSSPVLDIQCSFPEEQLPHLLKVDESSKMCALQITKLSDDYNYLYSDASDLIECNNNDCEKILSGSTWSISSQLATIGESEEEFYSCDDTKQRCSPTAADDDDDDDDNDSLAEKYSAIDSFAQKEADKIYSSLSSDYIDNTEICLLANCVDDDNKKSIFNQFADHSVSSQPYSAMDDVSELESPVFQKEEIIHLQDDEDSSPENSTGVTEEESNAPDTDISETMEGTNFNHSDQIHAITTSEYSSLSSLSSPPLSFSSRLPPDGQEFPPTCLETRSNNDNQDTESAIVVPILTKSEVLPSKKSLSEKVPEPVHGPPPVILSSYPVTEGASSWIKHSTETRTKKPEINKTNSRSSFWKKDEHSAGSVKDKIARFSSAENAEPLLQDFSKQGKIYKSSENISDDASNLYNKKNRLSKSCICVNKIPNNQSGDQNTTKINTLYITPKQPDAIKLKAPEKSESEFAKPTLNHAASFAAKSNARIHTRSQSMLDMSSFDAPWNNPENRRLTLNNLIEQRRRGFSKLRGLVIPQNEIHSVEPVLDLPEIKSKESNLLTAPRSTDRSKCNSLDLSSISHQRSNSTNLQSPSWKNNTFTSNLPRYSPAFKRKCLQVYITEQSPTADSGNSSSCSKTPDSIFQSDEDTLASSVEKYDEIFTAGNNNNSYGTKKLAASKSFDDKSSPSNSEINFDFSYHSTSENKLSNSRQIGNGQSDFQQHIESHSFYTPKKCSQPQTKHESGRSEDDSDNDSAVSSSQSSYISRECSPLPSHIQDSTNNPNMMSSTDLAKSKDGYTLINNNGVAGRILKPQSVEAINRKNILASAKCRSGRDFKNGSPLIQRKLSGSEDEKTKDYANPAEENVEMEVSKNSQVSTFEESSEIKDVVDHPSSVSNNANEEISNELTTSSNLNNIHTNGVEEHVNSINTTEESDHDSIENLNIVELKINVTENSLHTLHDNNSIEKLSRREQSQINLRIGNNDNKDSLVSTNEKCFAVIETNQYSAKTDNNATAIPHESSVLRNYSGSVRSSETKLPFLRAKSSADDKPASRISTSNVVLRNKYTFDKKERPNSMHIPSSARYDTNKRASVNDIRKQFEKYEMENQKSPSYPELKSSVLKSPTKVAADPSPMPKPVTDGGKIQSKDVIKNEPIKLNESNSSTVSQEDLNEIMTKVNEGLDKRSSTYLNPDETIVVVLHRETTGGSIGITLTGGTDYEAKEITVHKVLTGSCASKDGRLKKGDRILSINGTSMIGLTHRESLNVLKDPRAEVTLIVAPSKENSSTASSPTSLTATSLHKASSEISIVEENTANSTSPVDAGNKETTMHQVELVKDGAGLGFSLDGGRDSPRGDKPLIIKKIFTGGAAEKCGQLSSGDELMKVNDTEVHNMTRIEVWSLMKKLPDGKVTLTIRR